MTFNFVEQTAGNVTVKHHSTGSVVEIIVESEQEESQGGPLVPHFSSIWLDYGGLEDLIKVMTTIKEMST